MGPIADFVSAVGITLFSSLLLWIFRPKVSLIWGSTSQNFHQFSLPGVEQKISVWTEKFFVQNTGSKGASSVEVVFSDSLTSYNLWPPRDHTSKTLENGNFVIFIPSIAPRELVIVDMLDLEARGTKLLSVNCPDALTKAVWFMVTRQFSRAVYALAAYLMIAGFVGTVYLILRLVFSE